MQPHQAPRRLTDSMRLTSHVRVPLSLAVIGVLGFLTACAPAGVGDDASADAGSASPAATRPPFETVPPSSAVPGEDAPAGVAEDAWSAILADLHERLGGGLDASGVTLVSVEEVTWNDGSLGCPQPGELYTQALVDGVRVVVAHDGTEYDYRVPNGGEPRLCESSLPEGG